MTAVFRPSKPLEATSLPWQLFYATCSRGLQTVRPLTSPAPPDPYGWNSGAACPPSYWAFGRMRALLALQDARELRPTSVLEIAAGDGALCATLAAEVSAVTANDLRTDQLKRALEAFTTGSRVRVLGGDLFTLDPAEVGLVDLVVACEVLEHVADTVAFLRQLRRFTRPGGHILVTTPNGAFFRNRLPTWSEIRDFDLLKTRQFQPDADGHLFLVTPDEVCELASAAGLEVVRQSVWGSPALTGNAGLGRLAHPALLHPFSWCEAAVQRLPGGLRAKLCTALTAVLRVPAHNLD